MTNFIENNGTLPFPKSDLVPVPSGADPSKYVDETDWNAVCQALMDVQTFAHGAHFFGLATNASDPAPVGASNYLYMDASGNVHVKFGSTDTTLGAGGGSGATADGKTITGAGTVASPFVAVRDFLNVKDYGAKGDGVTNDASAISSAVSAATLSGQPLWFPSGTYVLGSTITIPVTSYLYMFGTDAEFSFDSTVHDAFWLQGGTSNVKFDGLAWQGANNDNKTQNIYAAIRMFDGCTDVTVMRCTFTQVTPMQCDDSHTSSRLHFIHNYCHNCSNGLHPCSDCTIFDNDFVCDTVIGGSTGRGQAIYIYGQQSNIEIIGNRFKNIAEEDIQIRSSTARFRQRRMFRIVDNHFENSNIYSLWLGSDATPDIGQFIVANNTFRNCNGPVNLFGAHSAVVTGNICEWDWEFPFSRLGGGSAITVTGAIGQASHLASTRGAIISNNKILIHHPFVGIVTLNSNPADGDTVVVGSFTYTFRTTASVAFDVAIGSSTQITAGNLVATLTAQDGLATAPTDAIRTVQDVFDNYYGASYGESNNNVVVIVGGRSFTLTSTSSALTITAVADYRAATGYGITVEYVINPLIESNQIDDTTNGLIIQQNYKPVVRNNTYTDMSAAGAIYYAYGNIRSKYSGNELVETQDLKQGRMYHATCADAFPIIEDDHVISQQLTVPSCTGRSGIISIGDGFAYTYLYYGVEVTGILDSTTLPYRWEDGDAVILYNGTANTTFNFKRTSPGANQFNSADSLIALINATASFTAAYETVQNDLGAAAPKLLIKIKAATSGTSGNSYTIQIRRYKTPTDSSTYETVMQPLMVAAILRDGTTDHESASFYGGAASITKTWVHSPIANPKRGVTVQGADAGSQALAPVVYQTDIIPGCGFYITTSSGAATTIAVGSNGAALPQGTINVASTTGFPTSGNLWIQTSTGVQLVTYTGTTSTTFTGCSGGSGTMSTGGKVAGQAFFFRVN